MLKQAIARKLAGSRHYPAIRSIYRRLKVDHQKAAELAFYQTILKPGDLVFDIGANVGFKSEVFLACDAEVVALEPNPNCHPVAEYDHGGKPGFTLVKKGVGAKEGVLCMNVEGTAPTSTFRDDWKPFGHGYAGGAQPKRIEVPVTTLDHLISAYGMPNYVKIDVEGFEVEVFKGLSQPIPLISFEYGRVDDDDAKRLKQCLDHLATLGQFSVNAIFDLNVGGFLLSEFVPYASLQISTLPPGGDCFVRFSDKLLAAETTPARSALPA